MDEMVDDLAAEQLGLQELLAGVEPEAWATPTPAEGWDVRDSVAHLADTDEVAADTVTGGPRSFDVELDRRGAEGFIEAGLERGRSLSGPGVLEWWVDASAHERAVLRAADPTQRVPWGLGMQARSLVTARLMETWAHGLDVRAALGAEVPDTDRLRHVAWIGVRALPYAFSVAGREVPPGDLRVELELPSGAPWTSGPADAPHRISGPAGQFCRLFVQRISREEAPDLKAEGDLADAALDVARAYL